MNRVILRTSGARARQTGLSLVELIVAMVIGLTVVGAALAMYISSGFSSRGGSALSQMTEDANIALSLIRSQVAMAGFSMPTGVGTTGSMMKLTSETPIFGCSGGAKTTTSQAMSSTAATSDLSGMDCNNSDRTPDSIVVSYQADARNTVATKDATPLPTDCVGSGLTQRGTAPNTYYLAMNQYFVGGGVLSCLGNGGGGAQPLVENIVDMKITYGVAGADAAGISDGQAQRYLSAQQVSAGTGVASGLWSRVTSARICIVVSSDTGVLDTITPYYDCTGGSVTPTDRKLYRAFTTTVVLQNRIL